MACVLYCPQLGYVGRIIPLVVSVLPARHTGGSSLRLGISRLDCRNMQCYAPATKVLNSRQSGVHCQQPIAMIRTIKRMFMLLIMTAATPHPGFSQSNPHLQTFFRQSVGLTEEQIAA